MASDRQDEKKKGDNWVVGSIWAFALIGAATYFWPRLIPFRFFEFWGFRDSFWTTVFNAWPIYAWAVGLTGYSVLTTRNSFAANRDAEERFLVGALISTWAGIVEELCFRWLLFFSAIVIIPIVDWLLLGFMGIHWIKWIYMLILCPVANFFTLGFLDPQLSGAGGWAIAAAIISTNGRFRNGHAYQGWFGLVNSWFLGMYFFWIVLHHGILAAMLIHFLYDFLIDVVVYVDSVIERRRYLA